MQQSQGVEKGLESSDDEEPKVSTGQPSTGQPQQTETAQPNIIEPMRLLMQNLMTQQTQMTRELLKELRANAPTANAPTVETPKKQPEVNGQSKPHEQRLEPRAFQRMEKFNGGEADFKEWGLDIRITAESVCPGIRGIMEWYVTEKGQGKETTYHNRGLEHPDSRLKEL